MKKVGAVKNVGAVKELGTVKKVMAVKRGGVSYRHDLICYVYNILSQHADSVHSIDVSLHADSAHSIDVSRHGDLAHFIDVSQDADSTLPARGRPFTHQTLAREDVLSNAGSRYK